MHWRSGTLVLSRGRPFLGELQDVLRMDTDRRSRRTGANTRGPAFEAGAGIALDRGLRDLLGRAAAEAAQEARLRGNLRELNHSVGTVLHAVAAADAGVRD